MGYASVSDLVNLETQLREFDPGQQQAKIREKILTKIGEKLEEKLKLSEVKRDRWNADAPLPIRPTFDGKAAEIVEEAAARLDENLAKVATREAKADAAAEALYQTQQDLESLFHEQEEKWEQVVSGLGIIKRDLGEELGEAFDEEFSVDEGGIQAVAELVIDFFDRSLPDHAELIQEARQRLHAVRWGK